MNVMPIPGKDRMRPMVSHHTQSKPIICERANDCGIFALLQKLIPACLHRIHKVQHQRREDHVEVLQVQVGGIPHRPRECIAHDLVVEACYKDKLHHSSYPEVICGLGKVLVHTIDDRIQLLGCIHNLFTPLLIFRKNTNVLLLMAGSGHVEDGLARAVQTPRSNQSNKSHRIAFAYQSMNFQ